MFNPSKAVKDKAEKAAKQKIISDLRSWAMHLVPEDLREGLLIDVSEVVCGDPSCAPVDTVFTFVWEPAGKGLFSIPAEPHEIDQDFLEEEFPDRDIIELWKAGKRARWPKLPELRFQVGDRVECRIGPHPVKGWAPGRIVKLYYSEPSWPPNMVVPYQIALHDGRLIFAPQDNDQLIRLRPPPAPDAPSSPVFMPRDDDDDDGEEGEWEEDEDGQDEDGQDEGQGERTVS